MNARRPATAALLLGALFVDATPSAAQTAAELFDVNTIQEIRLSVNSRDLRTLRERFAENTYYPADLTWRNTRVRNVGIRSRGLGSRNSTKIGLRVEMARYTTGQTLVGLSTIVLDNVWQDAAMIRERLAFTLFERVGLAAPRESFGRLYINNEYQGLYAITEEIDADFMRREFRDLDGLAKALRDLLAPEPLLPPAPATVGADPRPSLQATWDAVRTAHAEHAVQAAAEVAAALHAKTLSGNKYRAATVASLWHWLQDAVRSAQPPALLYDKLGKLTPGALLDGCNKGCEGRQPQSPLFVAIASLLDAQARCLASTPRSA